MTTTPGKSRKEPRPSKIALRACIPSSSVRDLLPTVQKAAVPTLLCTPLRAAWSCRWPTLPPGHSLVAALRGAELNDCFMVRLALGQRRDAIFLGN